MKDEISDLAQRVDFLLKKLWRGSQSRMARDLGVSQSLISAVLTGRQQPGRKLLAAITAHPAVSPAWMLRGEGDPLASPATEPGRRALHVAEQLFRGRPDGNGECLGGMLECPSRYYRSSRYWLVVDSTSPLVQHVAAKIAPGDAVLFEPDRAGWPKDLSARPSIAEDQKGTLHVAWIAAVEGDRVRMADGPTAETRSAPRGPHRRSIILDPPNHTAPTAQPDVPLKLWQPLDSVAAVGIYRCGPCGGGNRE